MLHANRVDEETRQTVPLSLSCARGLPSVNTECTRESGYAIIPLQLFYTNAECRYSKDYTVRRERRAGHATERNGVFPSGDEFPQRFFAIERGKEGGEQRRVRKFLKETDSPSIHRDYFAFQPRFAIVVKRFLASSKRSVLRRPCCVIVIDVTRDRARVLSSERESVCARVYRRESITIILNNRASFVSSVEMRA